MFFLLSIKIIEENIIAAIIEIQSDNRILFVRIVRKYINKEKVAIKIGTILPMGLFSNNELA